MNAEIKAEWVAALRSGEYKQEQGRLRSEDGDSFCCLGVLCDIASKHGLGEWDKHSGRQWFKVDQHYDDGDLPPAVVQWAGLPDSNPNIKHSTGTCIARVNDQGVPFSEIAIIIEEQL